MINISETRSWAMAFLQGGLSPLLTYHSYEHTLRVVAACLQIAQHEQITDSRELVILETAAWFHDAGFTKVYKGHEEESCKIAEEILPEFGATDEEVIQVCELIRSTRIPQSPKDILGAILCDADLDYLGSNLFPHVSEMLKEEWLNYGIIKEEGAFQKMQINFLNTHHYFTKDAKQRLEPVKRKYRELLFA